MITLNREASFTKSALGIGKFVFQFLDGALKGP